MVPEMEKRGYGRIVYNSSVAALTGGVIGPHYASSKSALHGLMHYCSTRYARTGLTFNCIAPALIAETKIFPGDPSAPSSDALRRNIPVGRFGVPDEIADVVCVMLTNGYITNKTWAVDGGWVAQ